MGDNYNATLLEKSKAMVEALGVYTEVKAIMNLRSFIVGGRF